MCNIFKGNPQLKTERLILRKLVMADAPDVFAYASDPEVPQYMTWDAHRSIEDSEAFIRFTQERYEGGKAGEWGIVHQAAGKLIGTIGIVWCDSKNKRAEIGYVLAKPYWGQGFIPEAAAKILEFAFTDMGLNRVECCHFLPNEKSGRVMQKLGMKYEGIARQRILAKGCYWDAKQYSILKEDWSKRLSAADSKDGLLISNDPVLLDFERICGMLAASYWANDRSRQAIECTIRNSLCWGAYMDGHQVGFARAVTDCTTIYWLADVIVDEKYRGQGIGKKLVDAVVNSTELKPLRGILGTRDAHGLYEQYGFKRSADRFMCRDASSL